MILEELLAEAPIDFVESDLLSVEGGCNGAVSGFGRRGRFGLILGRRGAPRDDEDKGQRGHRQGKKMASKKG